MHTIFSIDIAPTLSNAQKDNVESPDVPPEVKEEPWDAEYLDLDDRGSIKLEDGLNAASTDDDEPLSVHKEKKEESGRKNPKDRKRRKMNQEVVGQEVKLEEDEVSLTFICGRRDFSLAKST